MLPLICCLLFLSFTWVGAEETFIETINACILDHNDIILSEVTKEACEDACVDEDWCQSYEYRVTNGMCHVSSMNSYNEYFRNPCHVNGYDLYEKNDSGFVKIPGACILDHNDKVIKKSTIEDCEDACKAEDWCKSYEYRAKTKMCHVSSINSKNSFYRNPCHVEPGYSLYERVLGDEV